MPSRMLAVLRLLSHDAFLSGEAIAARLGCSRATVHNAVAQGAAAGLAVHAVRGRGYRLGQAVTWLQAPMLGARLAERGMALAFHESLDSTNTHLLRAAEAGAAHRTVAIAEWQHGGRGRRGRQWHAPLGGGLQFSLLWRSGRTAAELSGLSLAVGVALVRALRALGLSAVAVKWPNDIVLAGGKLAGVLIELGGDMLGPSTVVVGVGINVLGTPRLGEAAYPVADLAAHLGALDRNALCLRLIEALDDGLRRFEDAGFAAFHADWQDCHAYQGREVCVMAGRGEAVRGRALGVDERGALLLDTAAGVRSFHAGEVSLRGAP